MTKPPPPPHQGLTPDWEEMVDRAKREAAAHDAAVEQTRAAAPVRRRQRAWWLYGLFGAALLLAGSVLLRQRLEAAPAPTPEELDQGRRALLGLVNEQLTEHVRLHGTLPDSLDGIVPFRVEVAYRRTPEGYELSIGPSGAPKTDAPGPP